MRGISFLLGVSLAATVAGGAVAQGAPGATPAAGGGADALGQCESLTEAKRFAEARAACDRAVGPAADSAEALRARARMHFAQQKFEAAVADLDAALELNPRMDSAFFLRGMARDRLGQHAPALVDFETALLIAPQNMDYLLAAGGTARGLNQSDKAIGYYDRALKVNAASVPALMGRGHTLRAKGDYQNALKSFDAAVKAGPNETQPLHWRGHMYGALKEHAKAEADYTAALAITPRSADILSDRGDALSALGREAEALESYNKAVAADPSYTRGVRSRAVARFKAQDFFGARMDIEMAHQQRADPNTAKYLETIDHNLRMQYQAPLKEAVYLLREADPGGVSCESDLVSSWAYARALRDAGGDVAAAEAAIARKSLAEYRECLGEERTAGAGAADQLPALRLKIAELVQKQAALTARLNQQCAALPKLEICATLQREIADGLRKLKSDQKLVETAALSRSGDVAALDAQAPQRVAAAVAAARNAFAAQARTGFAEAYDRAELARHVRFVQQGDVNTIYSACGSLRLYAPSSQDQVDSLNGQLDRHRACLQKLGSTSSSASSDYTVAYMAISRALEENAAYKGFRCSVRPGAGCIEDAVWNQSAALATTALRDRARALSTTAGQVPDQVDAELTRLNDAVKRINSEIKSNNTWADISDALGIFAEAFNAASSSSNYRSTSTSAPGIR